MVGGLIKGGGGRGEGETRRSKSQAEKEIGSVTGKERDGAEHNGDLKKGFAQVIVACFGLGTRNLFLKIARFVLFFGQICLPFVDMCLIFLGFSGNGSRVVA